MLFPIFDIPDSFAKIPDGTYDSIYFKITNMSAIYQGKFFGDNYDILGIIENIGNKTFNQINLIVTLFDKNNTLIGVESTVPILDITSPGSKSPFKFDVLTNSSKFDHYLIEIGGK